MTTGSLDTRKSFRATWTAATFEEDLRRWSAFLADEGLTWSPDDGTRTALSEITRGGSARAAEVIGILLAKKADDALAARNDPRRVMKLQSSDARYLLSPDDRRALEAQGHRFVAGNEGALRSLATIPITLGVYFGAQWVCMRAGLDRNIAFVVALIAWAITSRVVRGRWPFQPA